MLSRGGRRSQGASRAGARRLEGARRACGAAARVTRPGRRALRGSIPAGSGAAVDGRRPRRGAAERSAELPAPGPPHRRPAHAGPRRGPRHRVPGGERRLGVLHHRPRAPRWSGRDVPRPARRPLRQLRLPGRRQSRGAAHLPLARHPGDVARRAPAPRRDGAVPDARAQPARRAAADQKENRWPADERGSPGARARRRHPDDRRSRPRHGARRVRGDQGGVRADRARLSAALTDLLAPRPVPLLTPDLPGTSGLLRVTEEDFSVEELPLYEPSGAGEHLYLTVEKTGRTTQEVVKEVAQALGARERDAGTAGLKDKRGVTVQRISVATKVSSEDALKLAGRGFRVLAAARHGNKLRPGHLRGNRFRIVVRGVAPDGLQRAEAVCARLREGGAANLFGPQRFGKYGDNAALGRAILEREKVVYDRFLRRMALSALQSEVFNRCLAARIEDRLFATAIAGDVLKKRETGGLFVCVDPAADALRVASGEVDPAGPLPGHSLFAAQAEALRREQRVLEEAGLDPASFAAGGGEMEGARRPYRIPVDELQVESAGADALVLSFALPKGSYALAVLREVLKSGGEPDFH